LTEEGTLEHELRGTDEAALHEFLRIVVPLAPLFAVIQAVAGGVLRDGSMLLLALLIALYGGCLIYARDLFDRGRSQASVGWIAGGLIVPSLAGLILQPSMLPTIVLMPLMALAVALPFIGARRLHLMLGLTLAWVIAIGVLGVVVPPPADPAPWYGKTFQIVTMAMATFLTILLFTRYRARLLVAAHREREVSLKLREVDRLKTTLMRAASHDLRTPTATILGAAETLRHLAVDEEEAQALLAAISRGANRLSGLLDDLLDAESLQAGVVELSAEPADVGEVVRDAVASLEVPVGMRVHLDVQPARATVDRARVGRVVENLVMNAIRHAPGSGIVWVLVRPHDEGAEIIVEDQGPGIPEADRLTIFAPFRRGDTEAPGTGLGLAIVEGFVGLHGGRVWVEDRLGGGASFRVILPGVGQGVAATARPELVVDGTRAD
jgi:signal transduction histidine kinase